MKKIMFNDKFGLTKAVLEGRKTMTRRLPGKEWKDIMPGLVGQDLSKANMPFKVGEVVAVAQNYNEVFDEFATIVYLQDKPTPDNFKAFGEQSDVTLPKTMPGWNNKMFVRADLMPYRIRIANVRVERLQDISDGDCFREGVRRWKDCPDCPDVAKNSPDELYEIPGSWDAYLSPRKAFAALIDRVCGKGTWDKNPWVFVYEFELVR